jgi:ATP-dependent Clp protease ATP-binding subunit ClpC
VFDSLSRHVVMWGSASVYPFERFNEASKRVLTLTQEEAERAHSGHIGTEHMLLGLLRERDTVAGEVLSRLSVDIVAARTMIQRVLIDNERGGIQRMVPTSRVKMVIEIAFKEARETGDDFVGTEHLLFGLLVDGECVAAHVLMDLGASLDKVRAEIDSVRKGGTIVEMDT